MAALTTTKGLCQLGVTCSYEVSPYLLPLSRGTIFSFIIPKPSQTQSLYAMALNLLPYNLSFSIPTYAFMWGFVCKLISTTKHTFPPAPAYNRRLLQLQLICFYNLLCFYELFFCYHTFVFQFCN